MNLRKDYRDDPHQQLLNRLQKQHEDLRTEDRHARVVEEINRMDLPEPDRDDLLRRFE